MKDLSEVEGSVTKWLANHIEEINRIYLDKLKLIELLSHIPTECKVSDHWFNKFIAIIRATRSPKVYLQYIYNVYLKGANLSIHEDE
jgi:hypothetical protein